MRPHKKQKQPTPTAAAPAAAGAASPQEEEKGDGSSSSGGGGGSQGSRDRPISPWRPPPVGPIASPQFHIDSGGDGSDGSDGDGGDEAWSAGSSSASSLLDEVEEGFERQLDALARLDGNDGDAPPVSATPRTTDTEAAEARAEEEGLVLLLLARLPQGDKRRRWILNSLRLHAAQAAARRRRLLCLGT